MNVGRFYSRKKFIAVSAGRKMEKVMTTFLMTVTLMMSMFLLQKMFKFHPVKIARVAIQVNKINKIICLILYTNLDLYLCDGVLTEFSTLIISKCCYQ